MSAGIDPALRVVVLVPTINNLADLELCITALQAQDWDGFRTVVVDSGSKDGTRAFLDAQGVEWIDDPSSCRADACNYALARLDCDVVIFTDDDCRPPAPWVRQLARHFDRQDVAGVGGPNIAPPDQGLVGRCVDVVIASPAMRPGTRYGKLGAGSDKSDSAQPRLEPIDHNSGCNAAYRKSLLDEVGAYPEGKWGAEDVVLDHRLTSRGHRLWFDPAALTWHRRRDTWGTLGRQMISYGRGRLLANHFEPAVAHPFHALPAVGVALLWAILAAAVAAAVSLVVAPPAMGLLSPSLRLAILAAPALALAGYAVVAWVSCALSPSPYRGVATVLLGPLVMFNIHYYYGLGYLRGIPVLRQRRDLENTDRLTEDGLRRGAGR